MKIEKWNVASVWCGVMPRVGSRDHMRRCRDCKRVKAVYWRAVREQSVSKTKRIWMDDQDGLIIVGDVLDGLAHLDDNSVEAIVTDPPYDLLQGSRRGSGRSNNPDSPAGRHGTRTGGFMGMAWDATGVAFETKTWEACLRVLKPGGHLVVFGGTRTHHRLWCAVEDAGFEVREMLIWLYGQGFPKSYNVGQAVEKLLTTGKARRPDRDLGKRTRNRFSGDAEGKLISDTGGSVELTTDESQTWAGWGTALKPAWEPILLARKPISEKNVAANVLKWGTGALNIDATRIETNENLGGGAYAATGARQDLPGANRSDKAAGMMAAGKTSEREYEQPSGRWPANVLLQCICDDPPPVPEKTRKRKGEPSQERRYTDEGATNFSAKPGTRRDGGGVVHESDDCPAGMLDAQTGILTSGMMKPGQQRRKTKGGGGYHGNMLDEATAAGTYGDAGGASRFFAVIHESDCPAGMLDEQSGETGNRWKKNYGEQYAEEGRQYEGGSFGGGGYKGGSTYNDAGGASRFFYCPKASKSERGPDNKHPTVKPVALMRWLIRLVTPPEGVVLDPFCGSGSTLVAAVTEGRAFVGIDLNPEYCAVAQGRVERVGETNG